MLLYPASFAHNNFAFNAHLNADGTPNEANVHATVTIDEREIVPAFRDLRESYHLTQGGALGRTHKGLALIRIAGRIEAPDATQAPSISDKERALRAAFDPYLCYLDSPSTDGAYALDFSEPTTDTATYTNGRIGLRYYCRPDGQPRTREALSQGGWLQYGLNLVAPDPRAYEQTEQTLNLTAGSPSGNVVNRGTVPSSLKATITMSAAGASNFTIARGGVSFVLDLTSMVNTDQIVVVFETCGPYGEGRLITKNGNRAFALKTSAASTWLTVPVGTTSFSISNTTGVSGCLLAWRSARA